MFVTILRKVMPCVFMLGAACPAVAATAFYTDRAAFDLATGGGLNFEDFSAGSTVTPEFTVTGQNVYINGSGLQVGRPTIAGATVLYEFNTPISAFGGDYDSSPGGNGIGLIFTLSTGEVVPTELSAPFDTFFGFVSDTLFTSLTVSGGTGSGYAETHTVDNISFGLAAPVAPIPVPASLPLLLAALVGGFGWRRWSKNAGVSL